MQLTALVERGDMRPVVSQTFALAAARQAFESVTQPHPPGKTVLTVR